MNPIHQPKPSLSGVQMKQHTGGEVGDEDHRKAAFDQKDIPWEKVESRFDPTFMKCDGKIVKYDSKGLAIWRVSFFFFSFFFFINTVLTLCVCDWLYVWMCVCLFIGVVELFPHHHFRRRHVVSLELIDYYLLYHNGYLHCDQFV